MNLETGVLQVHIEDIIPNRFQPRLTFDEQGLKELSDSIREHGIIQPLVLRKLGDKYEIIAGERRYKAAQMAGLTTVPAVIANIDDNKSAEVALVENVQRRDLTAIEEARSYKNLLDKGYLTQEQLAKRMGLSQPAIANKLRLLNLDEEVQQALLEERISERHARTLLSLQDKAAQREWLHRVINERLTVRQLDLELKKIKSSSNNDDIIVVGGEEETGGEVPIVSGIPSLEEIKANAVDITKINKQNNKSLVDTTAMESLETLEQNPVVEQKEPSSLFNQPIVNEGNAFTTATTIPEFNIATPNTSSTFVPAENIVNNNNDVSKFFSFDNTEEPTTSPAFTAPASMTTNANGLEIFDAPSENNSFVTSQKEEKPDFMNPTPSPTQKFQPVNNTLNTEFELNPNNKFFTPASEHAQEVTLEMQKDKIVDPMMAVEKLQPGYKETPEGTPRMELKDAIANIRSCIEDLGTKGFFIDVEEIDFDSNYQITMRIYKD